MSIKNIYYFTFLLVIISFSCSKESYEQYTAVPETGIDTTYWEDLYADGGVISGPYTGDTNRLVGSTWILPKYRQGSFSIIDLSPPDTLVFTGQDTYTYNGFEYTYDLYQSGSVYKLDLYQTLRFGYINTSLPLTIFDAGEFYLHPFEYQDIGMNTNNLYITMIRI